MTEQTQTVESLQQEASAPVVFSLMTAMGIVLYLSYQAFQQDYMLLFCGLFVFLAVYPSINLNVKNANTKISLEVSIAFFCCMAVFLLLKAFNIPAAEHSKLVIIFVTLLGMKLIFYPAYNVGVLEEEKAST